MSNIRDLWLRWKMLRLPWRKRFLIGQDLSGNTFWEFRDKLNANRFRRIAKPRHRSMAYADLKISPQWHQWLRQTRAQPPTMQEQHADIVRQAQLKQNAQLADERWASKKRYIEPKTRTPLLGMKRSTDTETESSTTEQKPNPWAENDAGEKPGSKFQPDAWTPGALKR